MFPEPSPEFKKLFDLASKALIFVFVFFAVCEIIFVTCTMFKVTEKLYTERSKYYADKNIHYKKEDYLEVVLELKKYAVNSFNKLLGQKTYINKKYKFQFQYPKDWAITEQADSSKYNKIYSIIVSEKSKSSFAGKVHIGIYSNLDFLNIGNWAKKYGRNCFYKGGIIDRELHCRINDKESIIWWMKDSLNEEPVVFLNSGKGFVFVITFARTNYKNRFREDRNYDIYTNLYESIRILSK